MRGEIRIVVVGFFYNAVNLDQGLGRVLVVGMVVIVRFDLGVMIVIVVTGVLRRNVKVEGDVDRAVRFFGPLRVASKGMEAVVADVDEGGDVVR